MPSYARFREVEVRGQDAALRILAQLTRSRFTNPTVRAAALAIRRDCNSRDDECEIEAIFNAIKPVDLGGRGTQNVPGLDRGLPYVADPRVSEAIAGHGGVSSDFFTAPDRILQMAKEGSPGEDCDGHSSLVAALLGAIGFKVGLRTWGRGHEAGHVYAVVGVPKSRPARVLGLDTTVPESYVGWEPPDGRVFKTAWL